MSSLDPPAGRGSSRRSFLARAALLAAAAATPAGLLAQAGADGLGDVEEAIAPTVTEASLSAPEYLARTIAAHPGEIAVVAVGPATNLLLAQLIRPSTSSVCARTGAGPARFSSASTASTPGSTSRAGVGRSPTSTTRSPSPTSSRRSCSRPVAAGSG